MNIGFQHKDGLTQTKEISTVDFASVKDKVLTAVKEHLPAELLNRMSAQIVFHPLTKKLMIDVLRLQIDEFLTHWKHHEGLRLPKFTEKKLAEVVEEIYDPAYGARVIERYIVDKIEPELIDQVMKQEK